MKYLIVLFGAFLGLVFESTGQDSVEVFVSTDTCVRYNRTIKEVKADLSRQGFKEVHKIYLVSFSEKREDEMGEMPLKNGEPDMRKMYESIQLTENDRDRLLLMLHNYTNVTGIEGGALCYNPHNGIIYFGKDGEVIGYMEICFGCRRFTLNRNASVSAFCPEKWLALEKAFADAGIKFGLNN